MHERTYFLVVGTVFTLVGVLHLARLAFRWEAILNGTIVPFWISWLGLIIGTALALESFRRSR